MKTAIYGGAFNPIHNGHINLAMWFKENQNLDRVIFVPTSIPPHKSAKFLASKEDRLNMLHLAVDHIDGFSISAIEFEREGKSYTYDTINQIKEMYPDDELFLIIGADQYVDFNNWYRAIDIIQMVTILAGARNSKKERDRMLSQRKNMDAQRMKKIVIADAKIIKVSSEEIRGKIKNSQSIDALVPQSVAQYIDEKRLYRK